MDVRRLADSSADLAERLITEVVDAPAPALPVRVDLGRLTRRERVEVGGIALAVAMQCIGEWRQRFYREKNRRRIDSLLADIERVSPQLDREQLDRLHHLTTILTESYVRPKEQWDLIDPDMARLAVLGAGLALRQIAPDWRRVYKRTVRRLRRRRWVNVDAISAAPSGFD